MNKLAFLGSLALASCIGMALGYGKIMPMNSKFTGYPFMANAGYSGYGYMPHMGTSGFGGFLGGSGGSSGGMGGMFGNIIQLFIFIFVINLLFSSTGIGSGGLNLGGKRSSHVGTNYGKGSSYVGTDYAYDDY